MWLKTIKESRERQFVLNRVKYYQIAIFQIVDGKIKECWRITDSLQMTIQLGTELKPKVKNRVFIERV